MTGHPMKICCECFMSVLLLNQEVWKEDNDLTCHIFFMRTSSWWSMALWSRHSFKVALESWVKKCHQHILFPVTCFNELVVCQANVITLNLICEHSTKRYICLYMINRHLTLTCLIIFELLNECLKWLMWSLSMSLPPFFLFFFPSFS